MKRRAHRGEEQPEPTEPTTIEPIEAPKPPSAGGFEPSEAEAANEGTLGTVADPAESQHETPHPLADLQGRLRDLLDYDQIAEVRLALSSRTAEIEKHLKKASDLGIREDDARRRLRLIEGSDTRFGLLRIFAPEEATYQRDIFFDPEQPTGRPDAEEEEEEVIGFTSADGRQVIVPVDQLEAQLPELRELHAAGRLPEHVRVEIMAQDFWHLIESEDLALAAETGAVGA